MVSPSGRFLSNNSNPPLWWKCEPENRKREGVEAGRRCIWARTAVTKMMNRLTLLTRRILEIIPHAPLHIDIVPTPNLPTLPVDITSIPRPGRCPGAPLDPAGMQGAVLAPAHPLVPPLEAPVRPALVVGAEPPVPHGLLAPRAQRLEAHVAVAVPVVARGPRLRARVLVAVVRPAPPHRGARVAPEARGRAAVPAADPVLVAAPARVAPLPSPLHLGRARRALARVLLAEEGARPDEAGLVA